MQSSIDNRTPNRCNALVFVSILGIRSQNQRMCSMAVTSIGVKNRLAGNVLFSFYVMFPSIMDCSHEGVLLCEFDRFYMFRYFSYLDFF